MRVTAANHASGGAPGPGIATASYSGAPARFLESSQPPGPAMNKPASAPDVVPPHELPEPEPNEDLEGSNATIHHPDPKAEQHPARTDHKPRGPYVTGNT